MRCSRSARTRSCRTLNAFLACTERLGRHREALRLLAPEPVRGRARRDGAESRQERLRPHPREHGAPPSTRAPRRRGRATAVTGSRFACPTPDIVSSLLRPVRAPLLDEALERGYELPFGCRMGSCGMCCARLFEGEVDQSGQFFSPRRSSATATCCSAKRVRRATSSCGYARTTSWIRSRPGLIIPSVAISAPRSARRGRGARRVPF